MTGKSARQKKPKQPPIRIMKKILNREFLACSSLSQLSLIGVVAWSGFAHPSDANGASITFHTENFFDGEIEGEFPTTGPPMVVGGGRHSAVRTDQPDGSTFFSFTSETVVGTPLVPDPILPGCLHLFGIEVVDSGGQAVLSEVSGFGFFYVTIDGAPQTMSDPFGLGLPFAPYPTDPTIQAFVFPTTSGGPSLDHSMLLGTELVAGMGFLGSAPESPAAGAFGTNIGFFDLVGLSAVKNDIDGLTAGQSFTPVPEPSSSVLLVSAFGWLLARRRR